MILLQNEQTTLPFAFSTNIGDAQDVIMLKSSTGPTEKAYCLLF